MDCGRNRENVAAQLTPPTPFRGPPTRLSNMPGTCRTLVLTSTRIAGAHTTSGCTARRLQSPVLDLRVIAPTTET
jgi:hypothetical protein